ncbi:hypothetical protein F7734_23015 [Scytonema sp. UIC 10036]|uniref:hypothetical protein n=1 Tax=Scytonema sp. UIC 10036 TaxID=2304196 RepID=UPI00137EF1F3|nr:hypothetical protein [Scytonema sp. UIC 10036]
MYYAQPKRSIFPPKAYRNASEEEQEQLQLKIAVIMQSQLTAKRQEAIARLRNTMDKASQEAQERGLTSEILESIFNDDE